MFLAKNLTRMSLYQSPVMSVIEGTGFHPSLSRHFPAFGDDLCGKCGLNIHRMPVDTETGKSVMPPPGQRGFFTGNRFFK